MRPLKCTAVTQISSDVALYVCVNRELGGTIIHSMCCVCADVMVFSGFCREVFVSQLLCMNCKRRERVDPVSGIITDSLRDDNIFVMTFDLNLIKCSC